MAFDKHDYVGGLEFTLHEVVTQRDQTLQAPLVNSARGDGKNGVVRINGDQKTLGSVSELIMKPRAQLGTTMGYCFFMVMKQIGAQNWKPIYKSEIGPCLAGWFEWNIVNLLTTDLVAEGNIDSEFRIEFF